MQNSEMSDRYDVSDAIEEIATGEVGQVLQVFFNERILAVNLPDWPTGRYLSFEEVRKL